MLSGLEYKPDAEQACRRVEAWWEREVLDRPTIQVWAPRPKPRELPAKHHASLRERWMDAPYVVECAAIRAANTFWGGELLPAFTPNLGPDYAAACYGSELQFAESTSWSSPVLKQWSQLPSIEFDEQNPYFLKMQELTRLSLEAGRGKFLIGITDLHPGGDLAAALRGCSQLCVDLVEEPEEVHALLDRIRPSFKLLFEKQYALLREAGQTITTTWLPLFCEGRYYVPSNDFSCMVSTKMFETFFLDELREEMAWLDRSIYHLDGPQAVRHLDVLLGIEELDAVQYVCGAGAGPSSRWLHVFQKVQAAGKCLHISVEPSEVDLFMDALRPEGVMLFTRAATIEEARALIAKVARWT